MYLVKTPTLLQRLHPDYRWRMPADAAAPTLYLTFDDGPIPEVTPWVLDTLAQYDARGTFFVVGENAERYPDLVVALRERGHTVGSHTWNHLNGWQTDNLPYYHNVRRCAEHVDSRLFRPPYGRLGPKQARFLRRHYQLVMWDVLSGDFDPSITAQACLRNVLGASTDGSILVFHDSLKAEAKLRYVLPRVLAHFAGAGFAFRALEHEPLFRDAPDLVQTRTS